MGEVFLARDTRLGRVVAGQTALAYPRLSTTCCRLPVHWRQHTSAVWNLVRPFFQGTRHQPEAARGNRVHIKRPEEPEQASRIDEGGECFRVCAVPAESSDAFTVNLHAECRVRIDGIHQPTHGQYWADHSANDRPCAWLFGGITGDALPATSTLAAPDRMTATGASIDNMNRR